MKSKATAICPKCGAANKKVRHVNLRVLQCTFCLETSPYRQFFEHARGEIAAHGPSPLDVVPRLLASGCSRVEPHYEGDEP